MMPLTRCVIYLYVIGCSVCSVICQIDYCGLGIAPFLLEKSLLEAENI